MRTSGRTACICSGNEDDRSDGMSEKRWEYGQIFVRQPDVFGGLPKTGLEMEKMNRAGGEGWEMVGAVPFTLPSGEVRGAFLLFKREIAS